MYRIREKTWAVINFYPPSFIKSNMKSNLITLLKLLISLGLLVLIFTHIDLAQVWNRVQYLSLPFVLFALIYYTGCQWLSCLRWQLILRATGHSVPILSLLNSYFAGMFFSIFLPGSYGGDMYRIYRVKRRIGDLEVATASVFLERFAGLAAVFALALIGLPLALKIVGRWDIVILFLVCGGVIAGGFLLIISPQLLLWTEPLLVRLHLRSLVVRIAKIQKIVRQFLQHRRSLTLAIGVSLLVQLAVIYYQYLLARQLQIPISFLELLIFAPISIVVTLLPISLGGLGVQEGLWAYLFSRVGLTAEQAVLLSLTFTMLGWLLSLPGGLIILVDSMKRSHVTQPRKKHPRSQ
jgi:glycosyltransferase 2 family protein